MFKHVDNVETSNDSFSFMDVVMIKHMMDNIKEPKFETKNGGMPIEKQLFNFLMESNSGIKYFVKFVDKYKLFPGRWFDLVSRVEYNQPFIFTLCRHKNNINIINLLREKSFFDWESALIKNIFEDKYHWINNTFKINHQQIIDSLLSI